MDTLTESDIRTQIKTKEDELKAFTTTAQEQVNKRQQAIQQAQMEQQNEIKNLQREIDHREGALEYLKSLIGEETPATEGTGSKPAPKVAKTNPKAVK
jgi:predicted  nucleic acid-binding Zn-ribbon protein